MTIQERYNIQRGSAGNHLFSGNSGFSADSAIDKYILAKAKAKNLFEQKNLEMQEDKIATDIANKLNKILAGFTK